MKEKSFASIILENNIKKPLDYSIPSGLDIKEGMLVEVPLRGSLKKGFVLSIKDTTNVKRVLDIHRVISEKVISKDIFSLALWMSKYYSCNLSKIFRNVIPSGIRNEKKPKYQILLSSNKSKKELLNTLQKLLKTSTKQAKVLEYFLKCKKKILLSKLQSITNLSKAPIESLIKKKIFIAKKVFFDEIDILNNFEYFQTKKKKLNSDQKLALEKIEHSLNSLKFETHLIYGVTGSGKTEIYLQAIEKALSLNKSAIMMVPEVSLTTQTIERFKSRFKEQIAIIHHKRSTGEKVRSWENVLKGKIKIVIGARSAIFCPIKNLGLIIVDEEHDPSYKQTNESPTYNAKHLAIMRAKITDATVVLASATPSIESYYNALNNKYTLSSLHNRIGSSNLATVKVIDMKAELLKSNSYFSDELLSAIKKRYEKGEQVLLFLNRRGYNTTLHCLSCSYIFKCSHCDITLTYHKKENHLSCHLCGAKKSLIRNCPECKSSEYIKYKGFGTEHIQSALHAIFPDIRTIRIDRDTTSNKDSHETLFKQFRAGKADVLIGTQMIVKGLHYPSITLVGILNSDGALNIPDFRSSERVFQLITQACGRSGREDLPGEVIIQSYIPQNSTIELASKQNYLKFYNTEIENRKLFDYPPFSQMIKIAFSSEDEKMAEKYAGDFRNVLIENLSNSNKIHPVLPAGRVKVKNTFKYQFLIRTKNILAFCRQLDTLKTRLKLPNNIYLFIDIDPIDIYF